MKIKSFFKIESQGTKKIERKHPCLIQIKRNIFYLCFEIVQTIALKTDEDSKEKDGRNCG